MVFEKPVRASIAGAAEDRSWSSYRYKAGTAEAAVVDLDTCYFAVGIISRSRCPVSGAGSLERLRLAGGSSLVMRSSAAGLGVVISVLSGCNKVSGDVYCSGRTWRLENKSVPL